jgi:transcriptional regulator with XRE-family HTH domain
VVDTHSFTLARIIQPWHTPAVLALQWTVGDVLRKAREAKGLTLLDVWKSTGIDKGTVSKIERGLTDYKRDTFDRICVAIGVTPSDVLASVPDPDLIGQRGGSDSAPNSAIEGFPIEAPTPPPRVVKPWTDPRFQELLRKMSALPFDELLERLSYPVRHAATQRDSGKGRHHGRHAPHTGRKDAPARRRSGGKG